MCKGGKSQGCQGSEVIRLRWVRRKAKQRGKEQVGRNGREKKTREKEKLVEKPGVENDFEKGWEVGQKREEKTTDG